MEKLIGHSFIRDELLLEALTHSSFSNEGSNSNGFGFSDNERLEFLGDAVIGLIVAEDLMAEFPEASEGVLSRWRSSLVSRKILAEISLELGLGRCVFLGRGEKRTGGAEKRSILAGVFESVVGALYLDAGIDRVRQFLRGVYLPWKEAIRKGDDRVFKMLDQKTFLQEKTQLLYKSTPVYELVDTWGLEHEKQFRVEIQIQGRVIASGLGRSKKEAEQEAASRAIEELGFL